jgi:membrane protease YdiL (CAAX protease family)
MAKERFFSRTGVYLWIAAVVSAILVMPYAFSFAPQATEEALRRTGLPLPAIVALSIAQSALLLGIATFAGLWAARKLGLGAPLLEAWSRGAPLPGGFRRTSMLATGLGLATGLLLVALDVFVFIPRAPEELLRNLPQAPPRWMGLLASFYGAIGEEILLRLFVLSFLALGIRYLYRRIVASPISLLPPPVFWSANLLAAVLFALGHLPATAQIMPLTPLVIARALALNGIAGVIAGWLFWRRGLEAAMLYHFATDLVLHAIFVY